MHYLVILDTLAEIAFLSTLPFFIIILFNLIILKKLKLIFLLAMFYKAIMHPEDWLAALDNIKNALLQLTKAGVYFLEESFLSVISFVFVLFNEVFRIFGSIVYDNSKTDNFSGLSYYDTFFKKCDNFKKTILEYSAINSILFTIKNLMPELIALTILTNALDPGLLFYSKIYFNVNYMVFWILMFNFILIINLVNAAFLRLLKSLIFLSNLVFE